FGVAISKAGTAGSSGTGTVTGNPLQANASAVKWTSAVLGLSGQYTNGDTYTVRLNAGLTGDRTFTYVASGGTLGSVATGLAAAINNVTVGGVTYTAVVSGGGTSVTIGNPNGLTIQYGVTGAASQGVSADASNWAKTEAFSNTVTAGSIY